MKRYLFLAMTVLILTALMCACSKTKDKDTDVTEPSPTIDSAYYAQQGAKASGSRIAKELEKMAASDAAKSGDKSNDDDKDDKDDEDDNDDKVTDADLVDDMDGAGKTSGQKSTDGDDTEKNDVEPNPTMQVLTEGGYADALTDAERTKTRKVALKYAKKNYSDELKTADLSIAKDDHKLYDNYMLYNRGNIVIYVFEVDGEQHALAVGRINADSSWKVLNKK